MTKGSSQWGVSQGEKRRARQLGARYVAAHYVTRDAAGHMSCLKHVEKKHAAQDGPTGIRGPAIVLHASRLGSRWGIMASQAKPGFPATDKIASPSPPMCSWRRRRSDLTAAAAGLRKQVWCDFCNRAGLMQVASELEKQGKGKGK